jgi:hypothetical protein
MDQDDGHFGAPVVDDRLAIDTYPAVRDETVGAHRTGIDREMQFRVARLIARDMNAGDSPT